MNGLNHPLSDAIEKFKSGINKGKFKKSHNNKLNASCNVIFEDAVYSAYLDASRTFAKIGDKKGDALDTLAKSIQAYFSGKAYTTQTAFDNFHNELCEKFIKVLEKANYSATYGQAQKIVNMTFKYLYCLDDASGKYEDYFKYCHIALDTFTLEWIWRNCRPICKDKVNKYEAWSNLEKKDYNDSNNTERPGYDTIVAIYRNHFPNDARLKGCTPFQAEFIFWPEIQLELSSEQFLIQLEEADKKRTAEIKKMTFEEKKKQIIKLILIGEC